MKQKRSSRLDLALQTRWVQPYLLLLIGLAFALRLVALDHLPFSLSLDEATNGVDALQLWRLRWLTPFLQNNFGRETLFLYIQAIALKLYGISILSLKLPAAMIGTLTVPLVYVVARRLQLSRLIQKSDLSPVRNPAVDLTALLAATGLAVSYWHLYFSRQGLRAIMLPPLLLGLIWLFWRGWAAPPAERGQWRWFGLAGLLLGLSFYSYLAARLLPLLFSLFILTEAARKRVSRKQLFNLFSFGLTAAVVALPLALYFYQNPQALTSRTQAISIFATDEPLVSLVNNGEAWFWLHFWGNNWLEQWPTLNLLPALGLLLGLGLCLYRWKQPASRFLLLWWGLGNLPVLLSIQDWEGQTTLLRGIAAWPATFLISATGLRLLGRLMGLRNSFRTPSIGGLRNSFRSPGWGYTLLWLWLILGGGNTVYQYFGVWPRLAPERSDHPLAVAQYANGQQAQLTLAPLTFYSETVTYFLLQKHYPHLKNIDSVSWSGLLGSGRPMVYLLPYKDPAADRFVLLAPDERGEGVAYLLPPLSPTQAAALAAYSGSRTPSGQLLDSEQEQIARIYPLTADNPLAAAVREEDLPLEVVGAQFAQTITLTSYQIEPEVIRPGETATLRLNWQAQQPVDGDYHLFIHLFHLGQEQRYGQVNTPLTGILFEAHRWPVGLSVPDIYRFTLPAEAAEGVYHFEIGLYHAVSQQRLPVRLPSTGSTPEEGDKVFLGKIQVQHPSPPQRPLADIRFGEAITLLGVDLPAGPISAGQPLTYTLHWQATAEALENYTVFTHLLDSKGRLQAQQDNIPQRGHYPTSWWEAGEVVLDPYTLPLPPTLEPGQYTLRVGLYQMETGHRLPLKNSSQDFVDLPALITIQR